MPDSFDNPSSIPDPVGLTEQGPQQSDDGQIGDLQSKLSSLESRFTALEAKLTQAPQAGADLAKAQIVLSAGQNVTISGGNGNWTITARQPTAGTVTGVLDCTTDPPTLNGSVVLS